MEFNCLISVVTPKFWLQNEATSVLRVSRTRQLCFAYRLVNMGADQLSAIVSELGGGSILLAISLIRCSSDAYLANALDSSSQLVRE